MSIRLVPILLVCAATLAQADPLYRWVEPDGTITFSATPPADGTPYREVEIDTGSATIVATEPARPPAAEPATGQARASGVITLPRVSEVPVSTPEEGFRSDEPGDRRAPANRLSAAECDNLRKRVTSLERRLQRPLTAEQMDNAVIRITRYQAEADSQCREADSL